MGKIEDLLLSGERVIKNQKKIVVGSMVGMPAGDLYLTNQRLIFLCSRVWSLLSPGGVAAATGRTVVIPLEEIKSVKKGFGSVKVQSNKEYEFKVSVIRANEWVDSILEASALSSPSSSQIPPAQSPTLNEAQTVGHNFCNICGRPLKPEDRFCSNCGNPV